MATSSDNALMREMEGFMILLDSQGLEGEGGPGLPGLVLLLCDAMLQLRRRRRAANPSIPIVKIAIEVGSGTAMIEPSV